MKRFLFALLLIAVCAGGGLTKEKKDVDEVTKYQQQLQALVNKRNQYVQMIQKLDVEIIRVEAVLQYLTKDDKEIEKK